MLGLAAAAVAAGVGATSGARHVVFTIIDDLGWTDVGWRDGSGMQTPHLDAIRTSGVELGRFYTQPVCSPTRASWLTGRYPFHIGMQHFSTIHPASTVHIPEDVPTLPELLLKAGGWETHLVGKWHLGYDKWDHTPTGRGFQSHYGYFQGEEDYFLHNFTVPYGLNINGYDFWANRTADWGSQGRYSLDVFDSRTDDVLSGFAARSAGGTTSRLFLYLAHQLVHVPVQVPPGYGDKCPGISDESRRTYCQMVMAVDDSVGRLVSSLKSYRLWNDTLLVVTTDNGGMPHYSDKVGPGHPASSGCNWPLRAGKSTTFEGGVRAIGMLNGGAVPAQARGTVFQGLMHVSDFFPTILGLVGVGSPAVDGVDQWSSILGNSSFPRTNIPLQLNEHILIPDRGVQYAILNGTWKLAVEQQKGNVMVYDGYFRYNASGALIREAGPQSDFDGKWLFDLSVDPFERTNLYGSRPDIVQELESLMDGYRATYVKPQKQPFEIRSFPMFHNHTWAPWLHD
eukprot:TRINITY_DN801_c0_g1_i1.p1 TRINITY_DN801_c0_g1~~TRINITY_DN801_c0_g1_i1.p1  ORF type:complete len:510 (+),score=136.85 TRINITY_DN801_c0_g1_i1:89-1618(+)